MWSVLYTCSALSSWATITMELLKYKLCIQSPITLPAASGTDEKPDKTVETTTTTEGEPSSGTVVGILNEDLSTGTVVSLPQSPISARFFCTNCMRRIR